MQDTRTHESEAHFSVLYSRSIFFSLEGSGVTSAIWAKRIRYWLGTRLRARIYSTVVAVESFTRRCSPREQSTIVYTLSKMFLGDVGGPEARQGTGEVHPLPILYPRYFWLGVGTLLGHVPQEGFTHSLSELLLTGRSSRVRPLDHTE